MTRRNPAVQGVRDANHKIVQETFERLGCQVQDTSMVGGGFPDMVVSVANENHLVEVKTPVGRIKESQVQFQKRWLAPVWYVRDPQQAVDALNRWREDSYGW